MTYNFYILQNKWESRDDFISETSGALKKQKYWENPICHIFITECFFSICVSLFPTLKWKRQQFAYVRADNSYYVNENLNNYFDFHVCLSIRRSSVCVCVCVSENKLHFLQLYDKMSLIKVAWYVLRVKKMHPESSSDPNQTAAPGAKPR